MIGDGRMTRRTAVSPTEIIRYLLKRAGTHIRLSGRLNRFAAGEAQSIIGNARLT